MIHQAISHCGIVTFQKQRIERGETPEDPSQDTTHRIRNLSDSESSQYSNDDLKEELGLHASEGQQTKGNAREKRPRITWPTGDEEV